jgi:hypothetical protein
MRLCSRLDCKPCKLLRQNISSSDLALYQYLRLILITSDGSRIFVLLNQLGHGNVIILKPFWFVIILNLPTYLTNYVEQSPSWEADSTLN